MAEKSKTTFPSPGSQKKRRGGGANVKKGIFASKIRLAESVNIKCASP